MAWTYGGTPSSSDLDMVRFLIGDVDSSTPIVTDEEITAIVSMSTTATAAAALVARAIAARFARLVDHSGEGLSRSASQQRKAYLDLANRLDRQSRGRIGLSGPGVGKTVGVVHKDGELIHDNFLPVSVRIDD